MNASITRIAAICGALVIALGVSVPVSAHHSVFAEYGNGEQVYLEGVVTELFWFDPHVRIRVETVDGADVPGGEVWDVTTHPPGILARSYGFPPDKLKVGDQVRIFGRTSQFGVPRFAMAGISVNGQPEQWLVPTPDPRADID